MTESIILQESVVKRITKRCQDSNCFIVKELFFDEYLDGVIQEKLNNEYIKYLLDNNLIPTIFIYPIDIIEYENKIEIWNEYIEGRTLVDLLADKLISLSLLNEILIKVSNAIKYLEANQAQHMDLHGKNIIISSNIPSKIYNFNEFIKIIDYGSMVIPGTVLTLGSNINFIDDPPRESEGYGMYTLIFTSLFFYLFHSLEDIDYEEYLDAVGSESMYAIIESQYPEYASYFKLILDANGLAFTEGGNGSMSSFSVRDYEFSVELQEEELRRLKKYSGANIEQYLIELKEANNW